MGVWATRRRWLVGRIIDGVLNVVSALAKLHPEARRIGAGVSVTRNLAYAPGGAEHRLDVYRRSGEGPLPVVIYFHGGGFQMMSKESHWMMGRLFAQEGYVVFNANYRLAPRHPFPAAFEDACAAMTWVHACAAEYGGDPTRIVLAGESAGANLALAVTVACSWKRPEQAARALFDRGVRPSAVVAMCGLLDVGDEDSYLGRRDLPLWMRDRAVQVCRDYLAGAAPEQAPLASPLCIVEEGDSPARPLPPIFASVGGRDPVLSDTMRLRAFLAGSDTPSEVLIEAREGHAYQAFFWRRAARRQWDACFAFLRAHVDLD